MNDSITEWPCCHKKIDSYDDIWDAIDDSDDTFSSSSKTIRCPYCNKFLEAFLDIDTLEISDEDAESDE
jgi:hypothetical protein